MLRLHVAPRLPQLFLRPSKARLAARGDQQDHSIYEQNDKSSPTISLESVLMIAGLAARDKRKVFTADVKGAYLNASMTSQKNPKKPIMKLRLPVCIFNIGKNFI